MLRRAALITTILSLTAGLAAAERPFLNSLQQRMLEDGKVIVSTLKPTDDSGVAALAVAVVKAPLDKVWPVVRDCEHFQRFMPRVKMSALRQRLSPSQAVCALEVSMPFPLSNLKSEVLSTVKELPDGWRRSWTLRSGNYKRNNGSWEVFRYGPEGEWSLLVYQIDVDPDMSIPDALLRKAQKGSLPDSLEAVRKRATAG